MSLESKLEKYDHGPLETYEIVWASGHVEHIQAHQVLMPSPDFSGIFGGVVAVQREKRWTFHGEIDGRWRLLLTAPEADIKSVRNVTHTVDRP